MKTARAVKIFVVLLIITQIFMGQSYATNKKNVTKNKTNTKNTITENKEASKNVNEEEKKNEEIETKEELVKAKVIELKNVYEREEDKAKVQEIRLKITSGKRKEEKIDAIYVLSYEKNKKITADNLSKNDTVYVKLTEQKGEIIKAEVEDVSRNMYMILLIILFLGCLVIVEKKKSISFIINIVLSVISIYAIFMMNVYKGNNAVLFSLITVTVMILINVIVEGLNKRSISAGVGTFGGVIAAGIITIIFTKLAKVTGGEQGALILNYMNSNKNFNFRGLIFSGMIIAVLGAAINNSQKITKKIAQEKVDNPEIGFKELFKFGVDEGKEGIGKVIYVVVLAFLGITLNINVLYMSANANLINILNSEAIASNIICTFAAGIGIIVTIPITSIVAAFVYRKRVIYKFKSENIVEGKRSLKL